MIVEHTWYRLKIINVFVSSIALTVIKSNDMAVFYGFEKKNTSRFLYS